MIVRTGRTIEICYKILNIKIMVSNFKGFVCVFLAVIGFNVAATAQAPIKKFVEKTGSKKIKDHLLKVSKGDNGFSDGHGKFPYATTMPDTIALITFYIVIRPVFRYQTMRLPGYLC